MPASTLLPTLTLPQPLVLLPTARIQLSLDETVGTRLIELVQRSEVQLVIGTVPCTSPTTIHSWGTAARVVRVVRPISRSSQRIYHITLHGLSRIHFPDTKTSAPFNPNELIELRAEYPKDDGPPTPETVAPFRSAASKLLDSLAQDATQQSRRDVYLKISHMIEEVSDDRAPWMADVIVAGINKVEYNDKLEYLSAAGADDRLRRATELFVKQASITEVTKKIAKSIDESLSKQQKEFFLRQQLAAIQRELSNLSRGSAGGPGPESAGSSRSSGNGSELDDTEQAEAEDLAEIRSKIEAMAKDSEERKMAVREWKRLQRIPSGSVEHGVIRNYLEWITCLPWPSSSAFASASSDRLRDRSFLADARRQLDEDHYGLDKIKKRLIEYLAVVRLKQLQAERETIPSAPSPALVPLTPPPNTTAESQHPSPRRAQGDATSRALALIYKALKSSPSAESVQTANQGSGKQDVPDTSPGQKPPGSQPQRGSASKAVKGPILLFVGPPGTGKTSLGHSIARALDRPFQRISLGGVRDEAEIRGHRRTYVASGPGSIVQALRKAGRPDPVILLDEIDKVGQSNFHGDPAAALLEVLDPEQNHSFNDHYINVPIDLSQVLFICTSNSLETISAPLLDRCEIVQLSGYTYDEKMHIANKFLLPKQLKANGLTPEHVTLTQPALMHIATHYTREAGVRSLERAIGAVVRYKAVEWAEYSDSSGITDISQLPSIEVQSKGKGKTYKKIVEEHELEKILGIARWDEEELHREERRGLVYGLVVTGMGEGGILPIETIAVPGSGHLKLTGSLGEVIKESGELALSWVKSHAYDLYITKLRSQDPLKFPDPIDIHLHLPSGAVKKDGPSAGIAMTCAFVSLLTGACVPTNVAMTGEVTLRGRVGPVGGIKEKVLGAHRAQVTKVILPWANRKDVEHDVPLEVRAEMQFVFVRTMEEVLEAAFGKGVLNWRGNMVVMESRL